MSDSLRPPRKCRANDRAADLADTAEEIRSYLDVLDDAGWTQSRIAVELGCSERSICLWSQGKKDMRTSTFRRLRALAAALESKRRVG